MKTYLLISKDMGAALMVGLITGIGLMVYEYFRTAKVRREEKNAENLRMAERKAKVERDDTRGNLWNLKQSGILSSSEYESKIAQLDNLELQEIIKDTDEYKQLLSLYNSNVLSQQEFEIKVKEIEKLYKNSSQSSNGRYDTNKPFPKENFSIDISKLSFQGYNKAKDIFNKAGIEKNKKVLEGLSAKLEGIFNLRRNTSPEDFLRNLLNQLKGKYNYRITGKFKEGLATLIENNETFGFINENYDITISPKYEFAEDFSEGLAVVRLNRKFGYIDNKGRIVISIIYEEANSFKNGEAEVTSSNRKFFIDMRGNKISN